jgi:hypothetical protein
VFPELLHGSDGAAVSSEGHGDRSSARRERADNNARGSDMNRDHEDSADDLDEDLPSCDVDFGSESDERPTAVAAKNSTRRSGERLPPAGSGGSPPPVAVKRDCRQQGRSGDDSAGPSSESPRVGRRMNAGTARETRKDAGSERTPTPPTEEASTLDLNSPSEQVPTEPQESPSPSSESSSARHFVSPHGDPPPRTMPDPFLDGQSCIISFENKEILPFRHYLPAWHDRR